MSELTLTPIIAPQDLECFRCMSIGLTDSRIQKNDRCIEIEHDGKIQFACDDCYSRLFAEIQEENL